MNILIKSAKIVNESSKWHGKIANVLISKGIIKYIGREEKKAQKIIEGKNCFLTMGWVDMSAQLADPGFEHKETLESGRKAAMMGGFTKVCVYPGTDPVIQSKNSLKYISRGNEKEIVELLPVAAVTKDTEGENMNEMLDLFQHGAIAFSDGDQPLWNSDIVVKTLLYLQKTNSLLIQKPDDKWLAYKGAMSDGIISTTMGLPGIPLISEDVVVQRDLSLLKYVGGRLHFSGVSSPQSLDMIKNSIKEGLKVTCDIPAYQLNFSDEDLLEFDTNYKVSPPFRSKKTNNELSKNIKNGTIQVLTSNHRPQDTESKKLEFDLAEFGITGLQTFPVEISALLSKFDFEKLAPLFTTNPRNLLDIPTAKIMEGEKADLTLFDPDYGWDYDENSNVSKSENNPRFGSRVKGAIRFVMNNGEYYSQ